MTLGLRPNADVPMGVWALVPELLVDDLAERFERLRARQEPAVDEERWRGVDAKRVSMIEVLLHRLAVLTTVEALLEGRLVQPYIPRELTVALARQRALVFEDLVVELPEFPLVVGTKRRLGGRGGLRVVGKRIVAVDDADFVAVGAFDLLESRTDPRTERSLKVRVFDDRHLRGRWPSDPFVLCNRDRDSGRV